MSEIEQEIGEELLWDPNPENRDKTIAIFREADLRQRGKWDEYINWFVDMTVRFRKAFSPRVKGLDLTRQEEPEESTGA